VQNFGATLRDKDFRIKVNLEKCSLLLHNILLPLLHSDNMSIEMYTCVFVYVVFYIYWCDTWSVTLRKDCRVGLPTVLNGP
jgi:hypothetical protein